MKIVVIGMDNTGKTTLVETLSKKLGLRHVKSPGPKLSKEEMEDQLLTNLKSEEDLILERFSIVEELVYGNILRGKSKFELDELIKINFQNYNLLFIYCRPNKERIFNFGDREQMEGVIEQSEKLLEKFDSIVRFMKSFSFDVIEYDYDKMTIDELLEGINEYNTRKKRNH